MNLALDSVKCFKIRNTAAVLYEKESLEPNEGEAGWAPSFFIPKRRELKAIFYAMHNVNEIQSIVEEKDVLI